MESRSIELSSPRRRGPRPLPRHSRGIFASLHSRNYRLYFTGQGISLIGSWMQSIALSWLVYRLTGSVFLLGLIGFLGQIPTFLLTPFSGVLTDRFNRLRIMTLTQVFYMVQATTLALLVLFNAIEVWHLIALSVFSGIVTAFDAPARQSLVVDLIDNPDDLGNAIALNSAIFNGARLIGPAIAGIAIAALGEGVCFAMNAASFVAVIGALLQIKLPPRKQAASTDNFKKSFSDGFRYTFQSIPIRRLMLLLATLGIIGMPFIVLLPAYAKEILKGDSHTLGLLMSALGAGALTSSIYMASRKTVLGLGTIIAASFSVLGLALMLASFSQTLYASMIVFYFGGGAMILTLASMNTLLQTIADEDKRGRVMSFYAMAVMGTSPFGNLLAGTAASGLGIPIAMLIAGAITLVAGIWFGLTIKSFRKFVRPIYVDKGILPGLPNEVN